MRMRSTSKFGTHLGIYLVAFAMLALFSSCLGGRSATPAWGPGLASSSEALNHGASGGLKSSRSVSPEPDAIGSQKVKAAFARLPLSFIPNRGQVDERVRFYGRNGSASFFFARDEVVYSFIRRGEEDSLRKVSRSASEEERGRRDGGAGGPGGEGKDHRLQGEQKDRGHAVKIRFVGANPDPVIEGGEELPGKANYFIGADPARWKQGLPTYGQVRYRELWPGIELVYRGAGGRLKYEFLVKPGADPKQIQLAYRGIEGLSISDAGDLILKTASGELRDSRPVAYQEIGGKQLEVKAGFVIPNVQGGGRAGTAQPSFVHGFRVEDYDPAYSLILDPGLEYSTFLGGSNEDYGRAIAVDGAGNAYVMGYTSSSDFPATAGAFDPSHNGNYDTFVVKLNSTSPDFLYATFLGGSSDDYGRGIALDAEGNVYVTGYSTSSDFPTTAGAFDTSHNGNKDTFVAKLSSAGSSLLYATFLGGSYDDFGYGIALDGAGNAYVTGSTYSFDFPTTTGAFDTSHNGGYDTFVAKLNSTGSGLLYATFLGGSSNDSGYGIALDGAGNAHVTGLTWSPDFLTTAGAYDTSFNGYYDAFVAKLNSTGSSLLYATFLGGSEYDYSYGIALDGAGNAYVTGGTASSDFPTTAGAYDTSFNGYQDIFVAKLNSTGSSLLYSTFLGGASDDQGYGIALDGAGNAYVTGGTTSSGFPATAGAFDTSHNGYYDAFVARLNSTGSGLPYATFLGGSGSDFGYGIALDSAGSAYVTGETSSTDFPTTAGAKDTGFNGSIDVFVAKLSRLTTDPTLTLAPTGPTTIAPGDPMSFSLALENPGDPLLVKFQLALLPELLGRELSLVGPFNVTLPTGTSGPINLNPALPQNLQSMLPGGYSFIGRLLDGTGGLLGESRVDFTVPAKVSSGDNFFNPRLIVVRTGETLQWTNHGSTTHTTTSSTGMWDSGNLYPDTFWSVIFPSVGNFPYHCTYHPGMTGGVIVVNGPLSAGPERAAAERRFKKSLNAKKLKEAIRKSLRP